MGFRKTVTPVYEDVAFQPCFNNSILQWEGSKEMQKLIRGPLFIAELYDNFDNNTYKTDTEILAGHLHTNAYLKAKYKVHSDEYWNTLKTAIPDQWNAIMCAALTIKPFRQDPP